MPDNNKLCDTILDMEASLSTNLNGYSVWHYGADIHGITRETLKNAVEALKAREPHVMALDEMVNSLWIGDVVWLEVNYDGETGIEPFLTDVDVSSYYNVLVNFRDQYYLIDSKCLEEQVRESMHPDVKAAKFRFWSSKPTDEQRKTVEWDA